MYLNEKQRATLLRPINPQRVMTLKKGSGPGLAYVAQHDIRAHLNRIFGFGRWSMRVISTEFVFEEKDANNRWKACYRATVGIDVCAPDGTHLATYEDSHASGNAPQPDRAEAHALALTIAVSTAMKRAAACLGDQFGLSLYNKGQTSPFVVATLLDDDEADTDGVAVTSLGDEESANTVHEDTAQPPLKVERSPEFLEFLERLRNLTNEPPGARLSGVVEAKMHADSKGWTGDTLVNDQGMTLDKIYDIVSKGGQ